MDIQFTCDACGQLITVSKEMRGGVVKCPNRACGCRLTVPSDPPILADDIIFDCPFCSHQLVVSKKGAGLKVACPECGKRIVIPIPVAQATPTVDSLMPEPTTRSAEPISTTVPSDINRFNWGAFCFTWLWALCNNSFNLATGILVVCSCIPNVGMIAYIALSLYGGITGGKRAWRNKRWQNIEHFKRVQHTWAVWGGVAAIIAAVGVLAAVAAPMFLKSRGVSQLKACVSNMEQVERGKEMLQLIGMSAGVTVPDEKILEYMKAKPVCPNGGHYTFNPLGTEPACSVHGSFSEAKEQQ